MHVGFAWYGRRDQGRRGAAAERDGGSVGEPPRSCFYPSCCPKAHLGMTALVGQGGRQGVAFLPDEGQREAVLAYCKIAAASGALLSIKDLVELLAIDATEEELQEGIASDESLSAKVYVESGLVALI